MISFYSRSLPRFCVRVSCLIIPLFGYKLAHRTKATTMLWYGLFPTDPLADVMHSDTERGKACEDNEYQRKIALKLGSD